VVITPLLPWLVMLPGGRWLFPLAAPLTIYPAFAQRVREGRYAAAWALGMVWAALLSLGVIWLVHVRPGGAEQGILHGSEYRREMFDWILTGAGQETTPSRFLPEHLVHLAAFLLLTLASGGYVGLVLGALLMAYMSYFVGQFGLSSSHPVAGSLAAWVPWSVIRVMSFVLLGSLFARPLLLREPWPFGRREHRLMALAAAGIAADLLLKTLLAPAYGHFLRHLLLQR
jgi:hypothetical protein